MFWRKKIDSKPLGVPLNDLLLMLQPTTIKARLDGSTLVAQHEHYTTRVEVVPPENRQSQNDPIRAVVRITTELPAQVQSLFKEQPEMTVEMNKFAALGALTSERGKVYVGSRLTIYEAEDAWGSLHLPLLMFATICGTEAILGSIRRSVAVEEQRDDASVWTADDMEQVDHYLSNLCVCTTGGLGFTAEVGLTEGAVSAAVGDHNTALIRLMADQPHPELGGGLFCLLQMPHRFSDKKHLREVCVQMNIMEMAAHDLPPHFGAWCVGELGNNPAYVTFFPNVMHSVTGIAVNTAIWAINRAHWANDMLAALGVRV